MLRTMLTDPLSLQTPIVGAPIAGPGGASLASAASRAGDYDGRSSTGQGVGSLSRTRAAGEALTEITEAALPSIGS